jgi:hydroxyacylglutathione hydrolase
MDIKKFALGDLRSNCYIVYEDHQCFIVDPGYESQDVIDFINSNQLTVEGIYLTHGHYDHIGGANALKNIYHTTVYAPEKDEMWFKLGQYNKLGYEVFVDRWVTDSVELTFLNRSFLVIETPGHSPGGTALLGEGFVFSGDTLFYQSIGRTDLILADSKAIYLSIKRLYQMLDDDIIVYPGHGRSTTIGHEKKNNPFVRNI